MKRTANLAAALAVGVILAACSTNPSGTGEMEPSTPPPSAQEETGTPAPSGTDDMESSTTPPPSAEEPSEDGDGPVDRTAEMQAIDSAVQTATETEPGRLDIITSIVVPRGEPGSPEAQQAIALCEAAVDTLGDTAVQVDVQDADGTTFVVYSQTPLPDDLPTGECIEF